MALQDTPVPGRIASAPKDVGGEAELDSVGAGGSGAASESVSGSQRAGSQQPGSERAGSERASAPHSRWQQLLAAARSAPSFSASR